MPRKAKTTGKKRPPRPTGRPAKCTPELMQRLFAAVAAGASLRTASEMHGVSHSTALEAIERLGLSDHYARARDERADLLAEEMLQIADVGSGDPVRDRLRLDARKWFTSKLAPRKYGDKVQVGGDPDGTEIKTATRLDLSGLTPSERAALMPVLARIAGG